MARVMALHSSLPAAAVAVAAAGAAFDSASSSQRRINLVKRAVPPMCRSSPFSAPRGANALKFITGVCRAVPKLGESQAVTVDGEEALAGLPAAQGVYAVFDKEGELQFVGMSRRISSSVQGHAKDLPDLCSSVKVAVVDNPDREGLKQAWQSWVEEHVTETGKIPPGNAPGNTTWTVKKKPKNDLRIKPSRNTQLTITLEQLIDKVVHSQPVVVFIKGSRTAPQCGFSHRVLTILEQQGVEYESVNVLDEDHNFGVREAVKNYSQWPTIPQVFVKGEFIGGADLLTEMAESGELRKLFDSLKAS